MAAEPRFTVTETISVHVIRGRQLRARRKALGLTQADVCSRLPIRRLSRLSDVETGKITPNLRFLDWVGQSLGMTLVFIPDEQVDEILASTGAKLLE